MPDISMCANPTCPLKEQCYRYTAKPSSFRQSYMSFKYDRRKKFGCDYFWDKSKT